MNIHKILNVIAEEFRDKDRNYSADCLVGAADTIESQQAEIEKLRAQLEALGADDNTLTIAYMAGAHAQRAQASGRVPDGYAIKQIEEGRIVINGFGETWQYRKDCQVN